MKELTKNELINIHGGLWWILEGIAIALIWDITGDPKGSAEALKEGSEAAQR
jgi:bacteriocin-like protein